MNCPAIRNVEILASLAIKELNLWRRLDNGEKIPRGDIEEAMEKVDKAREALEKDLNQRECTRTCHCPMPTFRRARVCGEKPLLPQRQRGENLPLLPG